MTSHKYFITPYQLKANGLILENVGDDKLLVVMRRAQDLHIEPALGTTLYKKLLEDIENDTLTGIYETIVNDYIVEALIALVDRDYAKTNNARITQFGQGSFQDPQFRVDNEGDSKVMLDMVQKQSTFYLNRLKGYLKDNRSSITEYDKYVCSQENINPEGKKSSYSNKIRFI